MCRTAVARGAFDVFARHPASGTSAGHACKLNAEFGGKLASYWTYRSAALSRRVGQWRSLARLRLSEWDTPLLAFFLCRRVAIRCAARGVAVTNCGHILVRPCEHSHQSAAFDDRTFIVEPKRKRAVFRRLHHVQHFFGFDLVERLPRTNALARRLKTTLEGAFLHRQPELGHRDFNGHKGK